MTDLQKPISLEYLIENGFDFEVPKIFTGRFSKVKERRFHIDPPALAILEALSDEYIRLEFSEETIRQAPYKEAVELSKKYSKRSCRIIAIAALGRKAYFLPFSFFRIPFITGLFSRYLYQRIDSKKLLNLTVMIHHLSNYPDYLNSLRLLSTNRTTIPAPEDQAPAAAV